MMWTWLACIAGAYVLGSIPFGVFIGKAHGINIREKGSKNIGATNVGRVLGRRWGLLCFGLDMAKGAVPVAVAGSLAGLYDQAPLTASTGWWLWLTVAMFALLGHMYSMFLRGGGGKGVATAFGGLLAMWPIMTIAAIIGLATWLVLVLLFRMISLASVVAALTIPMTVLIQVEIMRSRQDVIPDLATSLQQASAPVVVSLLLALLVTWKHRGNLARIATGTEPRIGGSSQETTAGH